MKKTLLSLTTLLLGAAWAMGQSATFTFNDGLQGGGGIADGTYTPGSSFTFSISMTTTGQTATHTTTGTSYWFATAAGDTAFSITAQSLIGSPFTDAASGAGFPRAILLAGTANDLGASDPNVDGTAPDGQPPNTTYFISTLTIAINGSLAPGTYTIYTTNGTTPANPGKTSIGSDLNPDLFTTTDMNVPQTVYTINVSAIPEPATWSLLGLGAVGSFGLTLLRRRRRS